MEDRRRVVLGVLKSLLRTNFEEIDEVKLFDLYLAGLDWVVMLMENLDELRLHLPEYLDRIERAMDLVSWFSLRPENNPKEAAKYLRELYAILAELYGELKRTNLEDKIDYQVIERYLRLLKTTIAELANPTPSREFERIEDMLIELRLKLDRSEIYGDSF